MLSMATFAACIAQSRPRLPYCSHISAAAKAGKAQQSAQPELHNCVGTLRVLTEDCASPACAGGNGVVAVKVAL